MSRKTDLATGVISITHAEPRAWHPTPGRPMGKNDLWIAATAKVSGLTLLTTDADFDHLHPAHLNRIRVDDQTGAAIP